MADEAARVLTNTAEGPTTTGAQMLSLANDVASLIAPHRPFKTLDEAEAWLLDHAGRSN